MKHGTISTSLSLLLLSILLGVLLCSTPVIIAPVDATIWAEVSQHAKNTAKRTPGYDYLKGLIKLGKSTPDNILESMRSKYNSAATQGLEGSKLLLIPEIRPAVRIFKQDMSDKFPKLLKPYLMTLLDVAPRGTMPGEEYRTQPIKSFRDKVISIFRVSAGTVPSNNIPDAFPSVSSENPIPPSLSPRNGQQINTPTLSQQSTASLNDANLPDSSSSILNAPVNAASSSSSLSSLFSQQSNTSTDDRISRTLSLIPRVRTSQVVQNAGDSSSSSSNNNNDQQIESGTSQLSRRTIKETAVAVVDITMQKLVKAAKFIFTSIRDLILLDFDQIIVIWNERFEDFIINFLIDNLIEHAEKRVKWGKDQYYPNIIRLKQLKAEEIDQLKTINDAIEQSAKHQQQQAAAQQAAVQRVTAAMGIRRGILRNLIIRSVDNISTWLEPEIKIIVDNTIKNGAYTFPWLLYNIVLDTIERRTAVCAKFQRPNLGDEINKIFDIGSAIAKWLGQGALQIYRNSGLATSNNSLIQSIRQMVENNPDVCDLIRKKFLSIYGPLHEFIIPLFKQPLLNLSVKMYHNTIRVLKRSLYQKIHMVVPLFIDQF
jgi:hypothetical protein